MSRILVVDDDADQRTVLGDILVSAGYAVSSAADGVEALVAVGKEKIDLIITDRSMPGVDGPKLLETLRKKGLTIPVIMISAWGEDRLWSEAIGLGAKDYVLKPFNPDEVLKLVKKYLVKGKK